MDQETTLACLGLDNLDDEPNYDDVNDMDADASDMEPFYDDDDLDSYPGDDMEDSD